MFEIGSHDLLGCSMCQLIFQETPHSFTVHVICGQCPFFNICGNVMPKYPWKETPPYLMGIMVLKDGTHHFTLWVCNISNAILFLLMIIYWIEAHIL